MLDALGLIRYALPSPQKRAASRSAAYVPWLRAAALPPLVVLAASSAPTSAESEYGAADKRTDYDLLPSGKLVQGAARVERAREAARTSDALRKAFHALESVAGVTPVQGRGWYGLRQVATDAAPSYASDLGLLDKLGVWTAGRLRARAHIRTARTNYSR